MPASSLHWFRDDLRLADNPALSAAVAHGPTLFLYILDEGGTRRPLGGASCWWLSRSLATLSTALQSKGCELVLAAREHTGERNRREDVFHGGVPEVMKGGGPGCCGRSSSK